MSHSSSRALASEQGNRAAPQAHATFLAEQRPWTGPTFAEPRHAMTCDVEDYFQVSAFEPLVPKDRWDSYECRIPRNVDRALELFDAAGAKATFFTLGWVAQRHPEVVRRIAAAGHEVASHGMLHVRVSAQGPDEFRADATTAKKLLEDVSGQAVRGYRAASWSIDERTPWVHTILREVGYEYSSSLYPIAHDHYGVPHAPARPFYVGSTDMLEIPATTAPLMGRNVPAAGGGYFRLLPFRASVWLMRRAGRAHSAPVVFYFHPWELDPDQPRMAGASAKANFRHYLNLQKFEGRLSALLKTFKWDRMDRVFGIDAKVGRR
jgi:polysaccharide deacetylase family protein (PEP-CTERM system associated)